MKGQENSFMYYILYNPLSASKQGEALAKVLAEKLGNEEHTFVDLCKLGDYSAFWSTVDLQNDTVILAGGDGTLNRFINENEGNALPEKLFYYPAGSGNDFKKDVSPDSDELIPLGNYIKDLPTVTVNGKTYRFINGIGFGIDGYCCEMGDKIRETSDKPVNYTAIAIKGLLGKFKPANATVTVDGVTKKYPKTWIAPTMKGRYYGGGMMVTPQQDRLDPEGKVSFCMFHGSSALKTLMVFPSIFKGEHVKHEKIVAIGTGHEITVEFDSPRSLQIDGETVLGVTSYTVRSGKKAAKEEPVAAK